MTILQEFQQAVKESNMSPLEISWHMKVSEEKFKQILDDKIEIFSDEEELFMYRFVWKHKRKQTQA